jgi:hypothetical protein
VITKAQLYRAELKNQWGWGGFTTHDLARCRLTARTVALVYNWWNIFVRLAEGDHQSSTVACEHCRTYASWPTVDARDHLDAWSFDMGAALSDVARFLCSLSNTAGAVDDRRSVVADSCSRGEIVA